MEEKVYIEFDLGNEEMIREAMNMPEIYGDYFIELLQTLGNTLVADERYLRYEDENMIIFTKFNTPNMWF